MQKPGEKREGQKSEECRSDTPRIAISTAFTERTTNVNTETVGFSIYSASNLPTDVLVPPPACADMLMVTIECSSTILLMGHFTFPVSVSRVS